MGYNFEIRPYEERDKDGLNRQIEEFFGGEGNPEEIPLYFNRNQRLKDLLRKIKVNGESGTTELSDKFSILTKSDDLFQKRGPRLNALYAMQKGFSEVVFQVCSSSNALTLESEGHVNGVIAYSMLEHFIDKVEDFSPEVEIHDLDNSGYIPLVFSSVQGGGNHLLSHWEIQAKKSKHTTIYTHAWTGSYSAELFLGAGYKVLDIVTGVSPDKAPSLLMVKEL